MYTVKQVAKQLDVSTETIRYYTRIGIIEPDRNPENSYRYYSNKDIYLIEFVRKAKTYGLTIHEIQEIIDKSYSGESLCPLVKKMVAHRHKETRDKIKELAALEKRLEIALSKWESKDDHIPTEEMLCPLIETELDHDSSPTESSCCGHE